MTEIDEILQAQAVQGEKIANIEKACEDIRHCLLGNGDPGLVVRTDRLEQRDAFKTNLFWLFATAVIGLVVKFAFDVFSSIASAAGQ